MIKRAVALLLCIILSVIFYVPALAAGSSAPPSVVSDAYVVMDADTGQILIEKNMQKKEYPASITKILTVALALEHASLEDKVTVSEEAVAATEPGSTHIALRPGEITSMRDLLYAAMLPSANDATNAIAEHISGSMAEFAELMNQKAVEIGCVGSHFVNPSGLPDDNHYTTAYDMAMITRYAMGVAGFMDVFCQTDTYTMQPTNINSEPRQWATNHMMLVTSAYEYEGAIGGKLGWTEEAEHTLVTLAVRDSRRLICVVMKSPERYDKFEDTTALFDYCFDNFQPVTINKSQLKSFHVWDYLSNGQTETVDVFGKESYTFLLHNSLTANDVSVRYDVPEYYSDGKISPAPQVIFSLNGSTKAMHTQIGSFDMDYTQTPLAVDTSQHQEEPQPSTLDKILPILKIAGIVVAGAAALIFLLFAFMFVIRCINLRKRKLRRARRRRPSHRPPPSPMISGPGPDILASRPRSRLVHSGRSPRNRT